MTRVHTSYDSTMKTPTHKHVYIGAFVVAVAVAFGFFVWPTLFAKTYVASTNEDTLSQVDANTVSAEDVSATFSDQSTLTETEKYPPVVHLPTPEPLYAAYMTSWVAGTPSLRNNIVNLVDTTSLNAIVIDIKDYSGKISYVTNDPLITMYGSSENRIRDIDAFIEDLHERGIYVIGRVTVFQDPYLAKRHPELAISRISDGGLWADKNGLNYLYPGNEDVWKYTVAIAKDGYARGFDEINFDYIRFPSDGNIKDMAIPDSTLSKSDIVKSFFVYVDQELAGTSIVTSADLFGMTTTNTDDLGIGQVLEKALPYFDYVCPMVYPSHYPPGFNGWVNPNANPHDLIKYVMSRAVTRAEALKVDPSLTESQRARIDKLQLRPWLQNFSLGQPPYTANEIHAQIQGTYDAGLTSWLLWDAANKYTYTSSALSL